MNESLNSLKIFFGEPKQSRAQKTLDDLLQAAEKIVDGADAESFDARSLAKVSGYSLGTLIKRLGAIENIFLYTIAVARSKTIRKIAMDINRFGPETTAKEVVERLVDLAFTEIERVGTSVIRYYEKRALKRLSNPSKIYEYTNEVVEPLLSFIESNRSNTFRMPTKTEATYICRSMFIFLERPFVENDPVAGSDEHRNMAIQNILGLIEAKKVC